MNGALDRIRRLHSMHFVCNLGRNRQISDKKRTFVILSEAKAHRPEVVHKLAPLGYADGALKRLTTVRASSQCII
jgi:hypothetical protein